MNSKGILVAQIMGIIIGVVAVFILFGLSNELWASTINKEDAGAVAYFGTLMKQITIADNGGVGDFLLWQKNMKDEKKEFLLIYFENKYKFSTGSGVDDGRTFLAKGRENKLCICYWDGKKGTCGPCKDLNYPVKYKESKNSKEWETGPWAIGTGEEITIKKVKDEYEFVHI